MRLVGAASLFSVLLSVGLLVPADTFAQGSDGGQGQVCLYEHANYGGWESCYSVGQNIPDLGGRRDQVSSIRIRGRAEITLFEHPGFQGNQVTLDQSIPDLKRFSRNWNDEVDGFRVSSDGFRGGGGRGEQYRERRSDRVCVYQHVGFQGNSQCWDAGAVIRDLRELGWNDGISSIRVFGDTSVAMYEHSNFDGERLIVSEDIPDLTRVSGRYGNWNDRTSSVRVEGGRRSGRR
jgi:hypothetical protein